LFYLTGSFQVSFLKVIWGFETTLEAISKKGFWFKIKAESSFHAKPDDPSI